MIVSTDQQIILACDARVHEIRKEFENATYEWEALWIPWAGLDQELVSPAVEGFETLGVIHVVD